MVEDVKALGAKMTAAKPPNKHKQPTRSARCAAQVKRVPPDGNPRRKGELEMLSQKERHYIEGLAQRVANMRSFLVQQPLPASEDASGWYTFLASLKEIQGNANNDVSFIATLMAKAYLVSHYGVTSFDAAEKAQGAPGLDIDVRLPDGRRLVAEIKTTVPYKVNDLGAQQKAMLEKDFDKLAASRADVKLFFVTERRTFDLMRTARYRSKLCGVSVVLLPEGEEIAA